MSIEVKAIKVRVYYYGVPNEKFLDFKQTMEYYVVFRYMDQEYQEEISWYRDEGTKDSPDMMMFTILERGFDSFKIDGINQVIDMIERYRGHYLKTEYESFTYEFDRGKVYLE